MKSQRNLGTELEKDSRKTGNGLRKALNKIGAFTVGVLEDLVTTHDNIRLNVFRMQQHLEKLVSLQETRNYYQWRKDQRDEAMTKFIMEIVRLEDHREALEQAAQDFLDALSAPPAPTDEEE